LPSRGLKAWLNLGFAADIALTFSPPWGFSVFIGRRRRVQFAAALAYVLTLVGNISIRLPADRPPFCLIAIHQLTAIAVKRNSIALRAFGAEFFFRVRAIRG